jgi:hypothetical protein
VGFPFRLQIPYRNSDRDVIFLLQIPISCSTIITSTHKSWISWTSRYLMNRSIMNTFALESKLSILELTLHFPHYFPRLRIPYNNCMVDSISSYNVILIIWKHHWGMIKLKH